MTHRRILVIAPQPFYADRGTPIALRQALHVLSERGEEVDLLTYPLGENIELPGLRIFRIANPFRIRDVPIGFSSRKLLLDLGLILGMWSHLRRKRYRCIHAVEEAAFPALVLGRRYNVPVIYDMQSSLPEQMSTMLIFRADIIQKGLRALERWLIRNVDFIVCSTGLEEYVRTVYPSAHLWSWNFHSEGEPASKEEIRQLRAELKITPASPVVLYAGNFEPYQGLSRLVNAAPHVLKNAPNTIFVFVGANSTMDFSSSESVRSLQERGALRLIPRQPRNKLPSYLAMADVLVSPREPNSNLPLKIFDYMSAGKPIVAVDSPAHRMVLNHERAVLVGLSAEQLAEAIVQLLKDPEKAERLSAAAKTYSETNLSRQAFTEFVSQMYDQARGETVTSNKAFRAETHSSTDTIL